MIYAGVTHRNREFHSSHDDARRRSTASGSTGRGSKDPTGIPVTPTLPADDWSDTQTMVEFMYWDGSNPSVRDISARRGEFRLKPSDTGDRAECPIRLSEPPDTHRGASRRALERSTRLSWLPTGEHSARFSGAESVADGDVVDSCVTAVSGASCVASPREPRERRNRPTWKPTRHRRLSREPTRGVLVRFPAARHFRYRTTDWTHGCSEDTASVGCVRRLSETTTVRDASRRTLGPL